LLKVGVLQSLNGVTRYTRVFRILYRSISDVGITSYLLGIHSVLMMRDLLNCRAQENMSTGHFAHHASVVISFEHLRIFVHTIPYLLQYCNLGVPLDAVLLSPMWMCYF
jgi:hypothetical protein